MLRAFDYLGSAKWPSLALVTLAPAIAYPYWLPRPVAMARVGEIEMVDRMIAVHAIREDDGDVRLSLRPVVAPGARSPKPVRTVEASWHIAPDGSDSEQPEGEWYSGEAEAGAAVIVLPERPRRATGVRLYLQTSDRREADAVVELPGDLPVE